MNSLHLKLWLLQHIDNPIWKEMLEEMGALPLKDRREKLGITDGAYGAWMRDPERKPTRKSLQKIVERLSSEFGIDTNLSAFSDGVDAGDYWKLFSDDEQRMHRLIDEHYYAFSADLIAHMRMVDHSAAAQLYELIKGRHEIARVRHGVSTRAILAVRFVHKLSPAGSVITAELAVPREGSEPFLYRGIVSELVDGQALYWVFSSKESRNRDMVFMITNSARHLADMAEMKGEYLTVQEGESAQPATFTISTQHKDSDPMTQLH